MLTSTEFDILARARDALARAPRGGRRRIVADAAQALGCSLPTAYRKLEKCGFDSARKRRCDAGETVLDDEQLDALAGVLRESTNNKGQRMPVATALAMLRAGGQLAAHVSPSTVSRQLYQRRMHPEQLAQDTPSQQMASKHPNHVWQVDSTTGAYYYLPGGRLRWMPENEYYKNKVANLVKASSDLLTRYAATDHTSHAFKVRHYLGGETAENLVDFVTWAMWKQADSPMHGVPLIMLMDPGAANKGRLMTHLAKRLDVRLLHHAPGAARVTGSVEKAHDLVRMHFETRLRFVDRALVDLDWLNERVAEFCAAYCASAVHTRHKATRFGKWLEIREDQLRVGASLEALREAAVTEPETRRVSNTRTVSYAGKVYDLALVPGTVPGLKVTVVSNPFRAPAIDVLFTCVDTGEQTWHVVEPMKTDAHGFREGAAVWGEDMRTAAYSDVDHTRTRLQREAYRTGDGLPTLREAEAARKQHQQAYAGKVDAFADVRATEVPTYMPRRATVLDLPQRRVEARRITVVEACRQLRARLGAAYAPQIFTELQAEFADGVPEDQLDALQARYVEHGNDPLRAFGGGES
jgi:hypothetical protein